jgi:hypothetical protein
VVTDVPRYVVHLDGPVETRWSQIAADYKHLMPQVLQTVDSILGTGAMAGFATGMMSLLSHLGVVLYGDELKAISKDAGVPLGALTLLQLAYEVFAFCTSIVTDEDVQQTGGCPMHIRTMDWDMKVLEQMTIEVDFRVRNQTVFLGTTAVLRASIICCSI